MDTRTAINLFKQGCATDFQPLRYRYSSIRRQYNRNAWQLDVSEGILRIAKEKIWHRIYFYATTEYMRENNMSEQFCGIISAYEYDNLKKLYFAGAVPDYKYLKQKFNINKQDA